MFRRLRVEVGQLVRRPRRLLAVGALLIPIALGGLVVGRHFWTEYSYHQHFGAAQEALEHYHPRDALEHLKACLEVQPKSGPALLLAARAARQAERFDEAEQYLETCISFPGDVATEAIVLERAMLRAQRGETDSVLSYCEAQIGAHHPDSPLILEALAQGFFRTFRLRRAGFCLKVWLDREPDNPRALFLRGLLREQYNNFPEAVQDFKQVLRFDPENDEARTRLASSLLEMSRAREAAPHLEKLRRRQPDNLPVLVNLARCRHYLGRQHEADKLLDQVLVKAPYFFPALLARGQLALQTGKPVVAEKWLRRCIAVSPFEYQPHFHLQHALYMQGKTAEADQELIRMGVLRDDLNRMRDIIGKQLEQTPNDPELHFQIGLTMLRNGSPQDAMRWFQSALKHDPHHRPTHAALAEYYMRVGNVTQSVRHREMAKGKVVDLASLPVAGKSDSSGSP